MRQKHGKFEMKRKEFGHGLLSQVRELGRAEAMGRIIKTWTKCCGNAGELVMGK